MFDRVTDKNKSASFFHSPQCILRRNHVLHHCLIDSFSHCLLLLSYRTRLTFASAWHGRRNTRWIFRRHTSLIFTTLRFRCRLSSARPALSTGLRSGSTSPSSAASKFTWLPCCFQCCSYDSIMQYQFAVDEAVMTSSLWFSLRTACGCKDYVTGCMLEQPCGCPRPWLSCLCTGTRLGLGLL